MISELKVCSALLTIALADTGLLDVSNDHGPIHDWDEDDLAKMGREYTAQRDELRPIKSEFNENGKRRASSPAGASAAKRHVRIASLLPMILVLMID